VKGFFGSALGLGVVATIGFAVFGSNGPGRAYVASWIGRRGIESRWTWLATAGGRLGSQSDSAIILVEFGDYQCPWCRAAHGVVDTLLQEYPNVALVYHPFPLAIHARARPAAFASICAEEQGAFKAMSRFLYTDTRWESAGSLSWNRIAAKIGVPDTAAFGACMQHERVAQLDTSIAVGHELGVVGTPTFLSKDGFLDGVPSLAGFRALLGLPIMR
jgi:protein-disulfide isomerase